MTSPTHLYRYFDERDYLLYVGISISAVQRMGQHASGAHWFKDAARVEIAAYASREAALATEARAILKEYPLHNIAGRRRRSKADLRSLQLKARGPGAWPWRAPSVKEISPQAIWERTFSVDQCLAMISPQHQMEPFDIENEYDDWLKREWPSGRIPAVRFFAWVDHNKFSLADDPRCAVGWAWAYTDLRLQMDAREDEIEESWGEQDAIAEAKQQKKREDHALARVHKEAAKLVAQRNRAISAEAA
jgi:hypothetical protein